MTMTPFHRRLSPDNPLRVIARNVRHRLSAAEPPRAPIAPPATIAPLLPVRGTDRALVARKLADRSRNFGDIVEALDAIDRVTAAEGNASHTTPRFRRELLYFLLDNLPRGPVIEVGTMNGGMTALFGFIAIATGRRCYGIDINADQLARTERTCRDLGVAGAVEFFAGDLPRFLDHHGGALPRPDLIFLDSSHDYNSTMIELRALHAAAPCIPRALAFHDYCYRHSAQASWFDDLVGKNPIAIDVACRNFFAAEYTGEVRFKRCGAFSGDGTVATPDNPGAMMGDYIDRYGTEGMMVIYP